MQKDDDDDDDDDDDGWEAFCRLLMFIWHSVR
jgi:hypothetical protein